MRVPQGTIHTIPVRLNDSEIPDQFRKFHWCNLFEADGFESLLRAFPRPKPLGAGTREPFGPEMILIPAGEFLMGSDSQQDEHAHESQQPQYCLFLLGYYLAKTPVTHAQYHAFLRATGREAPEGWGWGKYTPPRGKEDHPVFNVSWYDALAYCQWLSEVTGKSYGLPSEAEWENGARGTAGCIYPWGNQWNAMHCNSAESRLGETTSVYAYPQGASPNGILDMAGNVWEWTRSLWGRNGENPDYRYPYRATDERENLDAGQEVLRVLRGGAFYSSRRDVQCAYRNRYAPDGRYRSFGFRVVMHPAS
jgi:formylglycine-generating enzyme required for sulfatase activity